MSDGKLLVYVAAPFIRARFIDTVVVPMLAARGCSVVSTWHQPPHIGAESLDTLPLAEVQQIAATNDRDLAQAEALLVMGDPVVMPTGETFHPRETLCEARAAWGAGIPIVWEGRRCLTAYRPGVVRAASLALAAEVLGGLAQRKGRPSWLPATARAVG